VLIKSSQINFSFSGHLVPGGMQEDVPEDCLSWWCGWIHIVLEMLQSVPSVVVPLHPGWHVDSALKEVWMILNRCWLTTSILSRASASSMLNSVELKHDRPVLLISFLEANAVEGGSGQVDVSLPHLKPTATECDHHVE